MRSNELLFETVAANQGRVIAAGEDQAIIGAEQERRDDTAKRTVARDQGLFQC